MIYLHTEGEQHGPFTADELSELWKQGDIKPEALFWYRGMKAWMPVAQFKPYDPLTARTPATAIRLTTAPTVANAEIEVEIDIIAVEYAHGLSVWGDLLVEWRDGWGGRSQKMQDTLRAARLACLAELRNEAFAVGADAVIAIDLDYAELSGGGKSMTLLVASGTAVRLVALPPPAP